MALFVDEKYVALVGMKLERFKRKQPYVWNCRCPVCKDSQKSKVKARGYFYRDKKKGGIFYSCHNCHASMPLGTFIKSLDHHLYQQYQLETFAEAPQKPQGRSDAAIQKEFLVMAPRPKVSLPCVSKLDLEHPARKYVMARKIPVFWHQELFYAEDFKKFAVDTFGEERTKDKGLVDGDQRLVIPFYDEKGNLAGCQGRTLSNSSVRYITIKANEDDTKVFGLNRVNTNKKIYVLEGPIDSMFLPNAIATMDSALYRAKGDVYVYDNEPRNKQVVNDIRKTIALGYKVVIWPQGLAQKDVNEMVLDGIDVQTMIDTHTYEGLRASLELEQWRIV